MALAFALGGLAAVVGVAAGRQACRHVGMCGEALRAALTCRNKEVAHKDHMDDVRKTILGMSEFMQAGAMHASMQRAWQATCPCRLCPLPPALDGVGGGSGGLAMVWCAVLRSAADL